MTPETIYIAAAIGTVVISIGAVISWVKLPRIAAQVRCGFQRIWRLLKRVLSYALRPWTFTRMQKAYNDEASERLLNVENDVRSIYSHIVTICHILEDMARDDKNDEELFPKQDQMLRSLQRIRYRIEQRSDIR